MVKFNDIAITEEEFEKLAEKKLYTIKIHLKLLSG